MFSCSSVWCTAVLVHSLSAPQAHASVQVTLCCLQEHLLEHLLIQHLHLASSTTDSGVIAISDRIGTEILSASHNHPTLNGSGIFGKVLTPNICCGMYAKSIIMLISRTSRRWRDFIYPPGWLWKCFHLNFSAVLVCRSFLFPGACTKTSHSMKHQQKAFLQHQVDLVLWGLLVLLQWMPWKQSSCLYL